MCECLFGELCCVVGWYVGYCYVVVYYYCVGLCGWL